jgi:hypothetical protein
LIYDVGDKAKRLVLHCIKGVAQDLYHFAWTPEIFRLTQLATEILNILCAESVAVP